MVLVVGIHLGKTHSQVGIFRNNTFEIITDDQNRSLIPAYVSFPDQGPPLVGFAAREQAITNPAGTIYDMR
jgi:molecular chaperone DnaK (HSP70)